jgi:exodeoxyribonuclease VII small subunit
MLMGEANADNLTFEQSIQELERAVRDLEDGQIGLEESLARYEQGVGLVHRCYSQLRKAEQRILELTGTDDAGQPVLAAFKHEATAPLRSDALRRPLRPVAGDV